VSANKPSKAESASCCWGEYRRATGSSRASLISHSLGAGSDCQHTGERRCHRIHARCPCSRCQSVRSAITVAFLSGASCGASICNPCSVCLKGSDWPLASNRADNTLGSIPVIVSEGEDHS